MTKKSVINIIEAKTALIVNSSASIFPLFLPVKGFHFLTSLALTIVLNYINWHVSVFTGHIVNKILNL